jgi:hypothetical protein
MKTINESFSDEEWEIIRKLKKDNTWHDFILRKDCKKNFGRVV